MPELTTEDRQRIYELRDIDKKSWSEIAKLYPNVPRHSLRRIASRYRKYNQRPGPPPGSILSPLPGDVQVSFTQNADGTADVFSESTRIKTLEQLLDAAKVDLAVWFVDYWTANAWEQGSKVDGEIVITTLHQVKAKLSRNRAADTALLIQQLRDDVRRAAPVNALPMAERPSTGYLLELSVPDLHFGKWAWGEETGQPYDMDEAEEIYRWAVADLLAKGTVLAQPEKILLPLGNDFFNADNAAGTTTKGTPQDNHGLHRQWFRRARLLVRDVVAGLVKIAPVKIIVISGNHDEQTMYYLGEALDDWYYRDTAVTVDNSPALRKYHAHGHCLLGFTHGDKEKTDRLPMLMATEQPSAWAASEGGYREWHLGHRHVKQEWRYMPVNEVDGVRVRVIPSLSSADAWHSSKGYSIGVRAAEGYLWHEAQGLVALLSANLNAKITRQKIAAASQSIK